MSKIKKRIRDLDRLSRKPGMDAQKKAEAERALEALRAQLVVVERQTKLSERERKYSKRYHMVRFFERQKAMRQLRKANAEDAQLAQWYYVSMFPRSERYAALFSGDNAAGKTHPFMMEIHEKMKSGELKTGAAAIADIVAAHRGERGDKQAQEPSDESASDADSHSDSDSSIKK